MPQDLLQPPHEAEKGSKRGKLRKLADVNPTEEIVENDITQKLSDSEPEF